MAKILIIAYYWPPAGGPGVQRVLKFVEGLAKSGWEPIVLTVKTPVSPAYDSSLLERIPKACTVYKTDTWEPFNLYGRFVGKKDKIIAKDEITRTKNLSVRARISRWIRANLFIPDARMGWIPVLVKEGLKIIEQEKPVVIFSSSPPHSLQIGAKKLAAKSGLPWIADLRDPWGEAYWQIDLHNRFARRINKFLEKRTLRNATRITTVSEGFISSFSKNFGVKTECLYNGYNFISQKAENSQRFEILFIGNLSKYQSPRPLCDALNGLPAEFRTLVDITFVGKVFDEFYKLKSEYPKIKIVFKDYMPFDKLTEYARSSSLLLLIIHNIEYAGMYMTAKIFDYLAFRKPVLAIGPRGSVLEELLNETNSGALFGYKELDGIREYVKKQIEQWQRDPVILLRDGSKILKYSATENVKKLISIIDEVRK